jgi:hypothetical protein
MVHHPHFPTDVAGLFLRIFPTRDDFAGSYGKDHFSRTVLSPPFGRMPHHGRGQRADFLEGVNFPLRSLGNGPGMVDGERKFTIFALKNLAANAQIFLTSYAQNNKNY